ncbi:MAG: hypothetical protein HY606_05820 [Planctomycetes bacterium]|nr:hypothetical protein [Planctomycetota bacterium]
MRIFMLIAGLSAVSLASTVAHQNEEQYNKLNFLYDVPEMKAAAKKRMVPVLALMVCAGEENLGVKLNRIDQNFRNTPDQVVDMIHKEFVLFRTTLYSFVQTYRVTSTSFMVLDPFLNVLMGPISPYEPLTADFVDSICNLYSDQEPDWQDGLDEYLKTADSKQVIVCAFVEKDKANEGSKDKKDKDDVIYSKNSRDIVKLLSNKLFTALRDKVKFFVVNYVKGSPEAAKWKINVEGTLLVISFVGEDDYSVAKTFISAPTSPSAIYTVLDSEHKKLATKRSKRNKKSNRNSEPSEKEDNNSH